MLSWLLTFHHRRRICVYIYDFTYAERVVAITSASLPAHPVSALMRMVKRARGEVSVCVCVSRNGRTRCKRMLNEMPLFTRYTHMKMRWMWGVRKFVIQFHALSSFDGLFLFHLPYALICVSSVVALFLELSLLFNIQRSSTYPHSRAHRIFSFFSVPDAELFRFWR